MSRWWLLGFVSVLVLMALVAWGQAPPPSCETHLAQEYRLLTSENLLPAGPSPLPSWQAQLTAVVTQVRVLATHYEAKRAQAEQTERAWAELRERVRQLEVTQAQLTSELEQARKGQP